MSSVKTFGRDDIELAGGKGANLGELMQAGLPVPDGFIVTTPAYRAFVEHNDLQSRIVELAAGPPTEASAAIQALFQSGVVDDELRTEVTAAYADLGEPPVAVRSSATAEDLAGASFAGQQDTYLNVSGPDALLDAVKACWASLWTARAMAYRDRQGIEPAAVSLAVVVQQLVDVEAAGVMFTANPTNGRRGEVVIGAAWGLGESVVSGAVNTDDLVVDKTDFRVRSRRTADKAVLTVRVSGGTEEQPVPAERRRQPVLDDEAAAELARLGVRIEDHFGAPQDIEWGRAGDSFAILQSRPITALPLPEADPPTDWSVPEKRAFYFRASIVEQLPDPLSPLFADFVDGSVTRSLSALMNEFLGLQDMPLDEVGLPTVNGYAYYLYSWSTLARLSLFAPRAWKLLTSAEGNGGGQSRWRNYSHPRYQQSVAAWKDRDLATLPSEDLLAGVTELLDAGTEYYTAVQTIIPIAATSEVLFTWVYNALVRQPSDPPAPTFLLGYDSLPILAEKSLFDLASFANRDPELGAWLLATPVDEVVERLRTSGTEDDAAWSAFATQLQTHLERYGHTVYNLDFVNPVPADDPAPLIDTLRFYLRGDGSDPSQRQRRSVQRRDEATQQILDRLDPVRRVLFERSLRWAQSIAPVREDALADVGLAWPQLRRMLAELGSRAVAAGLIQTPEDVYWLRSTELTAAVTGGADELGQELSATIAARQELWRGQRRATPPQVLPQGTWMDRLESMMPASSGNLTGNVLSGTGASAGRVTAVARVLEGPQDFASLQAGDILVAGITTPAWTSLFARAAGVVTDVGGPLSHSSIVAREYGIPAVLGTGAATRRIRSGQRVTVDGDAGTVTLLDEGEAAAEPSKDTEQAQAGRPRTVLAAVGAAAGVATIAWWIRRRRR
ncbi:MAG: PEP/pyruvate-binding domain-containing protein [Propionibacteriaceae bacterium]